MFVGIGIGIGRQRFASTGGGGGIFAAYLDRVITNEGTAEAGACVDAVSGISLNSSLLLVPSGYKSGVVYSQIPTNGNGDLTFTRASSATKVNSDGEIEVVGSGVPRLDYSGGGCPKLLLEPQRTNLVTYSEEFNNAAWVATNASVTINDAISPDGTLDADKLVESSDVSVQSHNIRSSTSPIVTNQIYTYSIFAKGSGRGIQLRAGRSDGSTFSTVNADYNLTSGVVSNPFQNNAEYISSSIEDYGDGWYRCILQMRFTDPTNTTMRMQVFLYNESTNSQTYIGDGTSGAYLWGAQIEAGSYATTYIPTTNATVTRLVDTFIRNNIFTNGLISASGGTWYIEIDNNFVYTRDSSNVGIFIANDTSGGVSTNGLALRNNSSNVRLSVNKRVATVQTQLYITTTDYVKVAFKWNGTSLDVFENGVKVVDATEFTPTIMEYFGSFGGDVPKYIIKSLLFPTPLTDIECIELTTL